MIFVIIFIVLAGWFVLAYNGLIAKKNRVKEAASDILVQLKRRFDLIPNLVETVKGYSGHEAETLEKVTAMRARLNESENILEKDHIGSEVSKEIKGFMINIEAYPDLKANSNFLQLQQELADTENKIQASRRFYNGVVKEFNIAISSIPTNFIAKIMQYKEEPLLDIKDEEKENVKVSF